MQKIIIIAILAAVAFSAAVVVDDQSNGTTPAVGTKDGFIVSMGIIQKCSIMCKTCTQPNDATKCASCQTGFTLNATTKACECTTSTDVLSSSADDVVACKATSVTAAECAKISAYANSDAKKACVLCPSKFNECTAAAVVVNDGTACWAGVTGTGTNACVYTANISFVNRSVTVYDSATTTIKGYYHDATTFEFLPCNAGCLTCTATEKCSTCATGFTAVGTAKTACECSTTGFFHTPATNLAVDVCTACQAGCVTCSSATVCTVCDSSTHKLGSTTDSSSTCESLSSTDTSATTSTTDGEKDGESTSTTATDATSTNGVLLTAASMLLAVILA